MSSYYKLSKDEVLQAIADFLTKKYSLTEPFEAHTILHVFERTGGINVEVHPARGEEKE